MTGRRSGFSLVEVLCALLILGVGLVGMTEAVTLALRTSRESERTSRAVLLAAGRMEALRVEGYLFEGEEEGEFGEELPRYRWRQTISRAAIDGLYQVVVAVEDGESGERLYELTTLLFKPSYSSFFTEEEGETGGRGLQRDQAGGGRRGGRR